VDTARRQAVGTSGGQRSRLHSDVDLLVALELEGARFVRGRLDDRVRMPVNLAGRALADSN